MPKKVAIIDDEVDIRLYLAAMLEDKGYATSTISHTEPILERLLAEKPDLVILDIMMPGISGLSLYKQLRGNPAFASAKLAILSGMLTGAAREELAELTGDPDFTSPDVFIAKPVNVEEFLRTVDMLLS
ncbi:MAG: response regulator [Betaproteobacteria bacterium]|nr:response regulator [Betaproteobacteria bacterium]